MRDLSGWVFHIAFNRPVHQNVLEFFFFFIKKIIKTLMCAHLAWLTLHLFCRRSPVPGCISGRCSRWQTAFLSHVCNHGSSNSSSSSCSSRDREAESAWRSELCANPKSATTVSFPRSFISKTHVVVTQARLLSGFIKPMTDSIRGLLQWLFGVVA